VGLPPPGRGRRRAAPGRCCRVTAIRPHGVQPGRYPGRSALPATAQVSTVAPIRPGSAVSGFRRSGEVAPALPSEDWTLPCSQGKTGAAGRFRSSAAGGAGSHGASATPASGGRSPVAGRGSNRSCVSGAGRAASAGRRSGSTRAWCGRTSPSGGGGWRPHGDEPGSGPALRPRANAAGSVRPRPAGPAGSGRTPRANAAGTVRIRSPARSSRAPSPNAHPYDMCTDDECPRRACVAYRQGVDDCPLPHGG
jgi:hypothetical protein